MTNDKAERPAIISGESKVQMGLVALMLAGAWAVWTQVRDFSDKQRDSAFAVERLEINLNAKVDRLTDELRHDNELREAALALWISQLQSSLGADVVPDLVSPRKER